MNKTTSDYAWTEVDQDLKAPSPTNSVGMAPRQGLLEQLRRWLFPGRRPIPYDDDPRSFLTTTIRGDVDWKDRLRILVLGRVNLEVRTYTDVEVSEARSVSTMWSD